MSLDLHVNPGDVMRQLQSREMTQRLRDAQAAGATTGDDARDRQLMGVALEFEKIMLSQLMQAMRDTVETDGLFGQSLGGKTYIEMFDTEIVNRSTGRIALGLAPALYRQLTELKGETRHTMHIQG